VRDVDVQKFTRSTARRRFMISGSKMSLVAAVGTVGSLKYRAQPVDSSAPSARPDSSLIESLVAFVER
jgi:hypothetical protein